MSDTEGPYAVLNRLENEDDSWQGILLHVLIGIILWLVAGKIACSYGMPGKGVWLMFPIIGMWPLIVPIAAIVGFLFLLVEIFV